MSPSLEQLVRMTGEEDERSAAPPGGHTDTDGEEPRNRGWLSQVLDDAMRERQQSGRQRGAVRLRQGGRLSLAAALPETRDVHQLVNLLEVHVEVVLALIEGYSELRAWAGLDPEVAA